MKSEVNIYEKLKKEEFEYCITQIRQVKAIANKHLLDASVQLICHDTIDLFTDRLKEL